MAEEFDAADDIAFDPRDIVLRIPGEHFFCESIDLPDELEEKDLETHLEDAMQELSPFPIEHLQWGFHVSMEHRKALLFGALSSKLRLLGWENLDIFRRVFPSFVSLLSEDFGQRYGGPTIVFLWHEYSLTAAVFDGKCPMPFQIHSQTLTEQEIEEGSVDVTRSKLLALFDLDQYEIDAQLIRTGQTIREKDGFRFEHLDEDFEETMDEVKVDADSLWRDDVRGIPFKQQERKRRKMGRLRWSALLGAMATCCLLLFLRVGMVFSGGIVEDKGKEKQRIKETIVVDGDPTVELLNLKDVERRLQRSGKGGGIRPMRSLEYLIQFAATKADPNSPTGRNPTLWFTYARFPDPTLQKESEKEEKIREVVILRGTGEGIKVVNDFVDTLKAEGVTITKERKTEVSSDLSMKFELTLLLPANQNDETDDETIAQTDAEVTP